MKIHPLITRRTPFIILLAFMAAVTWYIATGPGADQPRLPQQPFSFTTKNGERTFTVEVASTEADQQLGLMNRRHLGSDKGMLFWFGLPDRIVSFWMKDTLIPLDMIFIGADGMVKSVHERAKPEDLTPIRSEVPVVAVLEIAGGEAAKQGIAPGDVAHFPGLPAVAEEGGDTAAPMTPAPQNP